MHIMKFLKIVQRKNHHIQTLEREIERLECTNEALREQWAESSNIILETNKWLGIGQRAIHVFNRENGKMIFIKEQILNNTPTKLVKAKRGFKSCVKKPKIHDVRKRPHFPKIKKLK